MTHTALARKYRPTRFRDLIGQSHVAEGLAGAVAKGRVGHAYLLTGPRGIGKTSAARILAMALNCERRADEATDGEPCGTCDSCRRIWSGAANLDVVEIDAASNRGVDDARDLRERATYAASGPERYKIYIIDEAHMLTREAWNALLKILEEPPPRVVFVFATTEPQKIANTAAPVLSRMQRFDFRRLGPQPIVERLEFVAREEGAALDADAAQLIGRAAHGGMRDALSILDQCLAFGEGAVSAARVREALGLIPDEQYAELLQIVAERRSQDVFPFVARLVDSGADLGEFLGGAGEALRALLIRVLGGKPGAVTDVLRTAVERLAGDYRPADLLRMLTLLAEAEGAVRRSPHARLHVEALLLHWTLLDRTVELTEVLAAIRGESPVAEQRPPRSPASSHQPDPPRSGQPLPPSGDPLLDIVRAQWPDVSRAVGRKRRVVGEILAGARPARIADDTLVVLVPDAAQREGVERARQAVMAAVESVLGRKLAVTFETTPTEGEDLESPEGQDSRRLDEKSDRAERLRRYRAKDPTLDAMADALDLELLD